MYVLDKEDGTVVFLEHNYTIYMEEYMIDYFANHIQCKYNDVRIDLLSKVYDPNNNNAHSITFPDITSIKIE